MSSSLMSPSSNVVLPTVALLAGFVYWLRKRKTEDDHWSEVIDRVLGAIVVIRVNNVKPFDGEQAGSAHATGFVVDADRGIILTNRHVIGCGPIRGEATFFNKEEVALTPLYRDPVHDFGFFHFDPSNLRYDEKARAIPLAPDAARVGLEVRVVGNDAGEKVSILSGTLARIDRNAPYYASEGYNDFNTFYYSAASNTSGGSSGSPVLDREGRAVALNAGGSTHSSASYYLPLRGVKRALDALQRSEKPRRSSLRVVWRYQTCDEMRRLGFSSETESSLRSTWVRPGISPGLLVVDQLVPPGLLPQEEESPSSSGSSSGSYKKISTPAQRHFNGLDVGDILLSIQMSEETAKFPDFDDLERVLDTRRRSRVPPEEECIVLVERGGVQMRILLKCVDLHALNPREFLEFGGGVLHPLSYCAVRNGNLDDRSGVYVAFAGFVLDAAGVPSHSVLSALGDRKTPDLDALELAISKLKDGDRVVARFYHIGDRFNDQVATLRVNTRWFPPRRWSRTDPTLASLEAVSLDATVRACWSSRPITLVHSASMAQLTTNGHSRTLPQLEEEEEEPVSATFQRTCGDVANGAVSSLCKVSFDVVHAIDGVVDWHFAGTGIVVDAKRGLVAVDRNTVVTSLGEASVTFAASVEIAAKVVFAHPTHNFALVQYDPSRFHGSVGDAPTESVLKPRALEVGDELIFVGLSRTNSDQPLSQRVRVTEMSAVNIAQAHVPRFRALNEEIAKFDQVLNKSLGGVLVDSDGTIVATWSCYSFYSWNDEKNYESFHAVDVDALADVVKRLPTGPREEEEEKPLMYSIGFGLKRIPLSTARTAMKLSEDWVRKLQSAQPRRSQVLSVSQLSHSTNQESEVLEGDLILAVDDNIAATFGDVERSTRDQQRVRLTVWRDGIARDLTLNTVPIYAGPGTDRVVVWCGLLLQAPHRAVLEMGAPSNGVYCSYYLYGSPASFYGMKACRFVIEINGQSITDLDDFVRSSLSLLTLP